MVIEIGSGLGFRNQERKANENIMSILKKQNDDLRIIRRKVENLEKLMKGGRNGPITKR